MALIWKKDRTIDGRFALEVSAAGETVLLEADQDRGGHPYVRGHFTGAAAVKEAKAEAARLAEGRPWPS
jgi:hypothetical protein